MTSFQRAPRRLSPSQRRTVPLQSHENPSRPGPARNSIPVNDCCPVMHDLIQSTRYLIIQRYTAPFENNVCSHTNAEPFVTYMRISVVVDIKKKKR